MVRNFRELLHNIRAFAFDVDGVCTNNKVLISESGLLLRNSNTKDGYAIHAAVRNHFPVAIITGGRTESVASRFRALGVTDIFMAVPDKTIAFNEFLTIHSLQSEQVLYMGDDWPDFDVLKLCGLPTCPADAVPEIQAICNYISPYNGGDGCVRDVIEQVLKVHGCWGKLESAGQ
ncbi:MAG: KdsC family phosphatase [Bacteroides sp.]